MPRRAATTAQARVSRSYTGMGAGVRRGDERPWHKVWRRAAAMVLEQAAGNAPGGDTGSGCC
jgi:hypothetical protein